MKPPQKKPEMKHTYVVAFRLNCLLLSLLSQQGGNLCWKPRFSLINLESVAFSETNKRDPFLNLVPRRKLFFGAYLIEDLSCLGVDMFQSGFWVCFCTF